MTSEAIHRRDDAADHWRVIQRWGDALRLGTLLLVVILTGAVLYLGWQLDRVHSQNTAAANTLAEVRGLARQIRDIEKSQQASLENQATGAAQRLCIAHVQANGLSTAISVVLSEPGSADRLRAVQALQNAQRDLQNIDTACPAVAAIPVPPTATTTPSVTPSTGGGSSAPGSLGPFLRS